MLRIQPSGIRIQDPGFRIQDSGLRLVLPVASGRSADAVRANNKSELVSTIIAALPLNEASAKVRTGPPNDDKPDYDLDVWAGELPLTQVVGTPIADPKLKAGVAIPGYVAGYSRDGTQDRQ